MDKNTQENENDKLDLEPEIVDEGGDITLDEEEGDSLKILKKLRDRLKVCEAEKQSHLEGWQRSRADYVNARREEDKRVLELEPYIKEKILFDIIPIADNFDMAFSNKEAWEKVDKNWRSGVEGIYSNLLSIFSSMGLVQIGREGEKFNPEEYQAVESVPVDSKEQDDIILKVVQKGYKFKNKILRPCKVRVGNYKMNHE